MALLNNGELAYNGSPDGLIDKVRGHAFRIETFDSELEEIKLKYPVIATIPAENGWEVEVVADELKEYKGEEIEPNLEHAYVYFMEYVLNQTLDGENGNGRNGW